MLTASVDRIYTRGNCTVCSRTVFNDRAKTVDSDQIIHRSSFYLIDQNGNIVNKYHYSNDRYVQELINDIEKLAK